MFMNPKYNYCVVSLSKFSKSKTTKDDFHPPYLHYLCSFVPLMQFSCVILSWRMSKCSSGDALNSQKNRSRVEKDPTDTLSNYKTILKVSFVLIERITEEPLIVAMLWGDGFYLWHTEWTMLVCSYLRNWSKGRHHNILLYVLPLFPAISIW